MNKILQIKKIFDEKILYNQQNNLYNFSTNLLLNEIKNNILNIIDEYYFIGIIEFNLLKQKIIKNIFIVKNKNYYNDELSFTCDCIIELLNLTYFPVFIDSYPTYNTKKETKEICEIKKNKKVKFYHKSNSFDVKNNFYDYSYINLTPIKYENKSENKYENKYLSDSEEENIFINKQRQNIKNKITLSNFVSITNYRINKNMTNKPKIMEINKTNKKKEYKILSKKNIIIDWDKSFISI